MSTRRLAAIMFTDISGYTALMQADEAQALQLRQRHREVFEQEHQAYRGQIVQYYGDGTLSVFDSAVDAAACAVAMQRAFQQPPQVPLRIGLHMGDILVSETEVMGDGVNLAARVESMAIPGSVLVSETVHDNLKNQPELAGESLGLFTFKNVSKPIEVFALSANGLAQPDPRKLQGKFIKRQSTQPNLWQRMPTWAQYSLGLLAFLLLAPFIYAPITSLFDAQGRSQSSFQEQGGFSRNSVPFADKRSFWVCNFTNASGDSTLDWLTVAAPFSISMDWDQDPYIYNLYQPFRNDNTMKERIDLARRFRCQYILEGEVSRQADLYQLDLSVTSVSLPDQPESFHFEGTDLFSLLDRASRKLKEEHGVPSAHLATQVDLSLDEMLTSSESAFASFGRGYTEVLRQGVPAFLEFDQAVQLDSTFAWSAYVLAQYYHAYQFNLPRAKELIELAYRHRTRLADVHEATVRLLYYRLTDQPDKALELAKFFVKIEPDQPNYWNVLIQESYQQGNYDLALEAIRRYRDLAGESTAQIPSEVRCLLHLGREKEGLQIINEYLNADPQSGEALVVKVQLLLNLDQYEEARETAETGNLLLPDNQTFNHFLAYLDWVDQGGKKTDAVMEQYMGVYRMREYMSTKSSVAREGKYLTLSYGSNPGGLLYPQNEEGLFATAYGVMATFTTDSATGLVDQMVMTYSDQATKRAFLPMDTIMDRVIGAYLGHDDRALAKALQQADTTGRYAAFLGKLSEHLAWRQTHPEPLSEAFVGRFGFPGKYLVEISVHGSELQVDMPDNPWRGEPVHLRPVNDHVFLNTYNLYSVYDFQVKGEQVEGFYGRSVTGTGEKDPFYPKLP